MILERYIIREISAPLVAILTVLTIIFAGYSAIRFLNDAVNGLLSGNTVVALIGLKVIIALEVLLPVTLYLAVVLALSRLYADCEITAMEACGAGPSRIVAAILLPALFLALVVTALSLYVRPWAYAKIYRLEATSRSEVDFAKIEAGRFYELGEDLVFFAEKLIPAAKQAENVWIWKIGPLRRELTTARSAYQIGGQGRQSRAIVFRNGYHHILNLARDTDHFIHFQENVFPLRSGSPALEYRHKAASTAYLARSGNPEDIAEFQWRLSTGITTVLMVLLAIPLCRFAPRRSKYGKTTAAIVLFFVFYNLNLIAKSWVEKGVVEALPGIWWVNLLLAALVVILHPVPIPLRYHPRRRTKARGRGGA